MHRDGPYFCLVKVTSMTAVEYFLLGLVTLGDLALNTYAEKES
jgi:hypothetical protein